MINGWKFTTHHCEFPFLHSINFKQVIKLQKYVLLDVCVCCVKQMQFSREQYNYNQINRSLSDEGDGPLQWCSLDNRQIIVRRNRFNYRYRLQIFRHTDCDPVETGLY